MVDLKGIVEESEEEEKGGQDGKQVEEREEGAGFEPLRSRPQANGRRGGRRGSPRCVRRGAEGLRRRGDCVVFAAVVDASVADHIADAVDAYTVLRWSSDT